MAGFPVIGAPDAGDTAWMLTSSALVLLMTPGLAFFYGGMVRAKNVLNMIMMSVSSMGVVTVLWVLYGYSLAFGEDKFNLFGDPMQYFGLKGLIGGNAAAAVAADPAAGIEASDAVNIALFGTIPQTVFVAFQLMFAIITVALVSGAIADRARRRKTGRTRSAGCSRVCATSRRRGALPRSRRGRTTGPVAPTPLIPSPCGGSSTSCGARWVG